VFYLIYSIDTFVIITQFTILKLITYLHKVVWVF